MCRIGGKRVSHKSQFPFSFGHAFVLYFCRKNASHNYAVSFTFPQVTRIVLLWVNNHFNDFEGDPAMTRFLEEFEKNLEDTVRLKNLSSLQFRDFPLPQITAIQNTFHVHLKANDIAISSQPGL